MSGSRSCCEYAAAYAETGRGGILVVASCGGPPGVAEAAGEPLFSGEVPAVAASTRHLLQSLILAARNVADGRAAARNPIMEFLSILLGYRQYSKLAVLASKWGGSRVWVAAVLGAEPLESTCELPCVSPSYYLHALSQLGEPEPRGLLEGYALTRSALFAALHKL